MFKSLLIFIVGLVIGALGYQVLMKNVHQQQIFGIITETELNQVENFLEIQNANDETRYCLLYHSARYNVHVLNQKIEGAENGKIPNGLIFGNIENVKKATERFSSLEKENLQYACKNT